MQAVILAAGISKRLRPLTDNIPKCLLKVGEYNFLHRMISNLSKKGINDIIIVTGYLEDKIKDYCKDNFNNLNIQYVKNDLYDSTNNSYSLWCAKDLVKDSFLLFDADIIFDIGILEKLLNSKYENCLAVNTNINLAEEEMKITVDDNLKVLSMSKELDPKISYGESIGIEKFSESFSKILFTKLNENMITKKEVNEYYEKTFQDLIDQGESIYAVDISEYKVAEVDTAQDIEFVEKNIIQHIKN